MDYRQAARMQILQYMYIVLSLILQIGTEAGVRLYLPEIMAITQTAIESQYWPTKAQAARAMNTIADKSGSNLVQPHLNALLTALITGLSGRTWDGKEALLQAVATVCKKCK
jgi:proteasome component ECM29